MQRDGQAHLDFIQNLEYKFLDLLSLDFMASNEEIIRQNITFRYNTLKARLIFMQNRLKDVSAIIKLKNPSLLLQLQKGNTSKQQSMYSNNTSRSRIMK